MILDSKGHVGFLVVDFFYIYIFVCYNYPFLKFLFKISNQVVVVFKYRFLQIYSLRLSVRLSVPCLRALYGYIF